MNYSLPPGHVKTAAPTIGGLSVILAAGLEVLKVLERLNGGIARLVSIGGENPFPNHLSMWAIWLATVLFAFSLAFAMLASPGQWRRVILWIACFAIVAGWAPVLSLAAYEPEIAAPLVAVVWSGACSLVYAAKHRMAADPKPFSSRKNPKK